MKRVWGRSPSRSTTPDPPSDAVAAVNDGLEGLRKLIASQQRVIDAYESERAAANRAIAALQARVDAGDAVAAAMKARADSAADAIAAARRGKSPHSKVN